MAVTKEEIVAAIKQMPLMEVADLVKMMEAEFGVSAAPVAGAAAPRRRRRCTRRGEDRVHGRAQGRPG
jgi:ribosomal protein L7/L12